MSVVLIFRDEERFLREAIESVLNQTHPNWELLLVDDGSTDGSTPIAKGYASRLPDRVRYLTHPHGENRGMSASRNLGIEAARGEFLAFLDGDDVYRPEKLDAQVRILRNEPEAAMVFGATEHWYSWTGRPEDRDRDGYRKLGVPPDTIVHPPRLVTQFLNRESQTPGTCALLVRRESALAVGGFASEFPGMFEDFAFLAKICLSYPVFVESGRWDRYRQHSGSHSRRMVRIGFYRSRGPSVSYARLLRWLGDYSDELGMDEPDFRQALRNELRPYRNRVSYGLAVARYRLGRIASKVAARCRALSPRTRQSR